MSSVTLEQRSKAIYVYLYALSLYSICTSSVCVLGPMCRGLCLLRSCLCLGKKKGRGGGGGRRSRYHSLCALSLCLSLDLLFLILLLLPWALLFFPRLFLFTSSFYLPLLILLIPLAPSICSPNRLLLSVFVRRRHLHLCPSLLLFSQPIAAAIRQLFGPAIVLQWIMMVMMRSVNGGGKKK